VPFPRLPLRKPPGHACRCRREGPDRGALKADNVRSGLAYFVVVWSLAVVLVAVAAFGVDDAMRLSAFFSGLVGVVLGFYFGKQGTELAVQQVETTKGMAAASAKVAQDMLDQKVDAAVKTNREALAKVRKNYEALNSKYPEHMEIVDALLKDHDSVERVPRAGGENRPTRGKLAAEKVQREAKKVRLEATKLQLEKDWKEAEAQRAEVRRVIEKQEETNLEIQRTSRIPTLWQD
jgi:hypothetical protein